MVDVNNAKRVFKEYVSNYNLQDGKIALKVAHILRVSELSKKIATSLNLSEEDIKLAELIGLLHDIGRFEQVRKYNTFIDKISINHGEYGVKILFEWGTEFDPAAVMADAARASGLPVLFSVQGVMRDCAAHLCDGVPEKYRRSGALWHAIDKIIPGELLDNMQASFDALAAKEAAALADARYVTGRTSFDRAACAALAPHARYYPCNETLRPLFYTGTLWHARDFAAAPVLLLPQGNYPLKNLHTVIKALPAVLAEYGDAELRIAGWPPLDKGPLLRPVIDRMFPYKLYCKRLAAQLGVTEHIRYTGPLDAAAMRQAYLEADAFLLPSGCENSPNSLGEAMLLGLPCVASAVGGIPSMLANGTEGLLYGDALDADALARAVLQVLHSPDGGTAMGRAARARALQTHDAARNAADLLHIYESILQEEHP